MDAYVVVMGIFNHIARRNGWVALHSALVQSPAGMLLLLGQSGRGKSTSTAAALGLGWAVSGDDIAFLRLDPHGAVAALGMPRSLSVPEAALPSGVSGSATTDHRTRRRVWSFDRVDTWEQVIATIEVDHGTEAETTIDALSGLGLVQALVRSEGFSSDNPGQDDVTTEVVRRLTKRPSHRLQLGLDEDQRLCTTMNALNELADRLRPKTPTMVVAARSEEPVGSR